jgi:tetratricopeptide (TPR) repeat protein
MQKRHRRLWIAAGVAMLLGVVGAWAGAASPEKDAELNRVDSQLIKKWKAEKRRATDAELYQDLGFSYFRQENFDRAFLYFNAATTRNPKLYWSWYYMGLLNLESAEPYFKKVIEANKDFAPAYYWLGRIYSGGGRNEAAIKSFEQYLKLAATDAMETSRIGEVAGYLAVLKAGGVVAVTTASAETQPLQKI